MATTSSDGGGVGTVDLYWIPLGAGAHVVRLSGRLLERVVARRQGRAPVALYHAALVVEVPEGRYAVEQTPVPRGDPAARGVVAAGPVGTRRAGRVRVFRYEIRRWPDGVIPDLAAAVGGAVRVADDLERSRGVLDVLPTIPTPVWGRDELSAGEMWTSNSIVSWALVRAGIEVATVVPPGRGRAPGWRAGVVVAEREIASGPVRRR